MKKRTITLVTLCTLVAVMLAGCGSSSASDTVFNSKEASAAAESAYEYSDDVYDYDYEAPEAAMADSSASGSARDNNVTDAELVSNSNRKLIKTVNLTAETREFDALIANISDRIVSLGGYAESTDIQGNSYGSSNGERTAFIVARIPAPKLDSFVQSVSDASNITNKSESAEDVTLQYADIEAHKESLKIEQKRLNELLEQADDLESIIELENRLTDVRYEIESYESRLRMMNNQVDYSTVNLNVREVKEYTPEPVEEKTFGQRLTEEFLESCEDAWEFIQDFIIGFIAFLPTLLVLLIILFIIFIIVFGIVKAIIAIVKSGNKKRAAKNAGRPQVKKAQPVQAQAVATPPAKEDSKPEENKETNNG